MNPHQTLIAQAAGLLESVDREVTRLGGSPAGFGFPEVVLHRLKQGLDNEAGKLRCLLRDVQAGGNLIVQRKTYREVSGRCPGLFAECLAGWTAGAIRALNLDGGVSAIVEKLFESLGKKVGVSGPYVTVLAESEFLATASKVIRLRYPVSSLWDLPVAAHEFGHLVGPLLGTKQGGAPTAYQKFMDKWKPAEKPHGEEYFADLFATFTLGPAYVNTCLLHRFDPAATGDKDHPSDAHRAAWILMGLELLADDANDRESGRYFQWFVEQRCKDWEQAVAASGGVPLDTDTATDLRPIARALWGDLKECAGTAAYNNFLGALRLSAAFTAGDTENVPMTASIRDILNAAWLLRLDDENDRKRAAAINQWANQLCSGAQG